MNRWTSLEEFAAGLAAGEVDFEKDRFFFKDIDPGEIWNTTIIPELVAWEFSPTAIMKTRQLLRKAEVDGRVKFRK
jgi:hypothetical protein